jgi:hypothetical protein
MYKVKYIYSCIVLVFQAFFEKSKDTLNNIMHNTYIRLYLVC